MKKTTRPEILTAWIVSLNVFNPVRGVCAILAVGLVAFGVSTPSAQATSVPVGNPSFETEGTSDATAWYHLPDGGSWVKGATNPYQILDISIANLNFATGSAPEGSNVLNLATASPLTQDLSTLVSVGDLITMSFYLGNSANQADPPASPTATFTLDGSDAYSEIVNNDATDGAFTLKTVQWTATSAGNLGIKFASAAGCWLDNVSVDVTTPMAPDDLFISGSLVLWAKDAAGTYSGGTWGDSSGEGHDLTVTSGFGESVVTLTPSGGPFNGESISALALSSNQLMSVANIDDTSNNFRDLTIIAIFQGPVLGAPDRRCYGVGSFDAWDAAPTFNPAMDGTIRYDNGYTSVNGESTPPDGGDALPTSYPVVRASRRNASHVIADWVNTSGILVKTINNITESDTHVPTNDDFYIGDLRNGDDTSHIVQVAVYNAALTDQQIAEISAWMIVYADGVLPAPAGSIVWSDLSTTNITATTAWPTATVNTNSDVTTLVWDSVDHAPGTTNDWVNRMPLGSNSAGVVTAQITGLSADSNFVWRIYGENSDTNGWSAAVPFATALTDAQKPLFTAATALSGSSIQLSWQDNAANETGYVLQRSTTEGSGYTPVATPAKDATSYTDVGLTALTTYYYQLAATNTLNSSGSHPALCRTNAMTMEFSSATYDGAVGRYDRDTWNTASNWDPEQVPDDGVATPWGVIIAANEYVSVSEFYSGVVTPVYTGDLTLQANATLLIAQDSTDADLRALGTGTITMNAGATIAFRRKANTVHNQDISLLGDAAIDLCQSTAAHNNSRTFNGTISGSGKLTVRGTRNNKGIFTASNLSWSGGLLAASQDAAGDSLIEGDAGGCFGTGNVAIDDYMSLQIDAAGAIDDGATLSLNGPKSGQHTSKLIMNANDQVFELWINGVQQPDGEYTSSQSWLSGTGTLTVQGPPTGMLLIVR